MMTRDQLLRALTDRVRRSEISGEVTAVLEESALSEALQLSEIIESADTEAKSPDVPVYAALGRLYLRRFELLRKDEGGEDFRAALRFFIAILRIAPDAVPEAVRLYLSQPSMGDYLLYEQAMARFRYFERTGNLEKLNAAVDSFAEGLESPSGDDEDRAVFAAGLGNALLIRFERAQRPADLDAAITASQEATDLTPAGHPARPSRLNSLGNGLLIRYGKVGRTADLDAAIAATQEAADLTPAGHPERLVDLVSLGMALAARFERAGGAADLDAAIAATQEAADLTPYGHPLRAQIMAQLGTRLYLRYEHSGQPDDLEASIRALQRAIEVTPASASARTEYLTNLGNALRRRFEHTGQPDDIDAAIRTCQDALDTTPLNSSVHEPLSNLGAAYLARYLQGGRRSDLDVSLDLLSRARDAMPADDPDRASVLINLGLGLARRFESEGRLSDLDAAIIAGQEAVDASTADHPYRAGMLANLSAALTARFERSAQPADLDAAITAGQEAVEAARPDDPHRAMYLSALGAALRVRFEAAGQPYDIDAAIRWCQRAVDYTPDDHPRRATYLSALGLALHRRFEQTGQLADLDAAIQVGRQAVDVVPAGQPERAGILSNLGLALQSRVERTAQLADVDAAIVACQQAVDATPAGHPNLGGRLTNLGNALCQRFERTSQIEDLDAAIKLGEKAVAVTPADHVNLRRCLSNLGANLFIRFGRTGQVADLDAAVRACEQALDATADDHPLAASCLVNLGTALRARFELTAQGADMDKAIQCWRAAAEVVTAATRTRVAAARAWARAAFNAGDLPSAADGYARAVGLLPELAWHGLDRETQEEQLAGWAGLAADAAACMVATGQPQRAVETLEQGRSVLWTQALRLRSDLSRLRNRAPELASDLDAIRHALDQASPRAVSRETGAGAPEISIHVPDAQRREQTADERRHLARQWDELIAEVRRLHGFEHFLESVPFAELQASLSSEPVVIVNVSPLGCHALIVTTSADPGVRVVALPGLTYDDVVAQANSFLEILHRARKATLPNQDRIADRQTAFHILEWLWKEIALPVLNVLGHTAPAPVSPMTRVWLCPTGPLTILPLHAAGRYSHTAPTATEDTLLSRVICSYVPTLASLRNPSHSSRPRIATTQLAVGMPHTRGLSSLPAVVREMAVLAGYFPPPSSGQHLLPPDATRSAVLDALPNYPWVHFACHAYQNQASPSESAFALCDGSVTVADLTALPTGHSELAFLSACETGAANLRLIDESIHLAAAMQLVGYQHVIATLWTIGDTSAPEVAENFYNRLFRDGEPTAAKAAEALHHAVTKLYETHSANPLVWAAYIHVGP